VIILLCKLWLVSRARLIHKTWALLNGDANDIHTRLCFILMVSFKLNIKCIIYVVNKRRNKLQRLISVYVLTNAPFASKNNV